MNKTKDLKINKYTIVVNTCDAYHEIWPLFFAALNEYWLNDGVKVILNTETIVVNDPVNNVFSHNYFGKNGQDKWGERLLNTLKSIETEYVLMVYDDFILEDFFDENKLVRLIDVMEKRKEVAVFYLTNIGLPAKPDSNCSDYSEILDNVDYKLNSAPALWRCEDLIKYTGRSDNPWAWEVFGSFRTFGDGKVFYAPTDSKKDLYKYNYSMGGAIYRGKWVPEVVVPKIQKYGLNINLLDRGLVDNLIPPKRSLAWKLEFLYLGYQMISFKVFIFLYRVIKGKLNAGK